MTDSYFLPAGRAEKDVLEAEARDLAGSWVSVAFDDHPVIVLALNPERQIVFGNKAAFRAFGSRGDGAAVGFRPGEILGCIRAKESGEGCGTSEHCRFCGAAQAIKNALEGSDGCSTWTMTRENDDGFEPLELDVWAKPFEYGGTSYILFTAIDVSEIRRREVLERIFYHDILNSAGGVASIVEILPATGDAETDSMLDMARAGTAALIDEIQAQRDLALAEKGQLAVSFAPFEPRAMIDEVVSLFRPAADDLGLAVTVDCRLMTIVTDRVLIRRITVNLVKNAIEASARGGNVSIRAGLSGGDFTLLVGNQGRMPPEAAHRVFSRSFSTKGKGRGIGTWSVKLLAESILRGRASFVTNERDGTVFRVDIPVLG